MTLAFDQLPQPDSLISRLDPRWKLTSLALAAMVVSVFQTLSAAVLALAASLVLAALSRLPWKWYLSRLGALMAFLLLFVVLLPFLDRSDGPRWSLGLVEISAHGLAVAFLLCLKAVAVVTLVLVLLATAPLNTTLTAAHALRVPGLLVQLAMLTYRYVFVLSTELARLRIALRVRGFRNRANRHSYRTIGHVAGTLLVRGYERAERVGHAMRCRGFDGRFRSLTEFQTRPSDQLFCVILTVGAGLLLFLDFIQR